MLHERFLIVSSVQSSSLIACNQEAWIRENLNPPVEYQSWLHMQQMHIMVLVKLLFHCFFLYTDIKTVNKTAIANESRSLTRYLC